jgi:hypothetical protein
MQDAHSRGPRLFAMSKEAHQPRDALSIHPRHARHTPSRPVTISLGSQGLSAPPTQDFLVQGKNFTVTYTVLNIGQE